MARIINTALMTWLALTAVADQVTIEPVKDNTLIQRADGSRSNAGGPIFAGRTRERAGLSIRRACLAFDVAAAVPPGATITEVRLTLRMILSPTSNPHVTHLHRFQSDWGEGSSNSCCGSGAPSTTGDATWIHSFYDDTFWSDSGGDYADSVSASLPVGGVGVYTWGPTPEMISDVQEWLVSPTENFGWCLIGDESSGASVKTFASREHGTPSNRPMLEITFTPGECDPCDMNCDGVINAFDIEPFLDILFNGAEPCDDCTGDADSNGEINAFDIEPFLDCLFP